MFREHAHHLVALPRLQEGMIHRRQMYEGEAGFSLELRQGVACAERDALNIWIPGMTNTSVPRFVIRRRTSTGRRFNKTRFRINHIDSGIFEVLLAIACCQSAGFKPMAPLEVVLKLQIR